MERVPRDRAAAGKLRPRPLPASGEAPPPAARAPATWMWRRQSLGERSESRGSLGTQRRSNSGTSAL
jgi:hypothetical protein